MHTSCLMGTRRSSSPNSASALDKLEVSWFYRLLVTSYRVQNSIFFGTLGGALLRRFVVYCLLFVFRNRMTPAPFRQAGLKKMFVHFVMNQDESDSFMATHGWVHKLNIKTTILDWPRLSTSLFLLSSSKKSLMFIKYYLEGAKNSRLVRTICVYGIPVFLCNALKCAIFDPNQSIGRIIVFHP